MAKKKLTKILWYGAEKDADGNPIVPAIAPSVEKHLEGLNEGEIYVHNDDANPCLFIRTNADKVIAIGGVDSLANYYLRKDKEDTAKEKITFEKGLEIGSDDEGKGIAYDKDAKKATAVIDELKKLLLLQSDDFLQGELGSGFVLKYDKDKKRSYLEIDEMLVRKIAYFVSLVIKDLKHVGGTIILSPASMTCSKVEVYDSYYRCYFEQDDGEKSINNEFVVGDLARCQTFNVKEGTSYNVSNTYYWRYVVGVGDDYIDLSIADCDSGSGVPQKGDEIVQLGNRTDESRQNAIILSTIGDDAPSIKQYTGIKYFYLSDDNAVTVFSPSGNVIKGNFISVSTGKSLESEIEDVKVNWDKVLEQTDKEFTIWFYPYEPTLENIPASEWVSEELRELHDQDLFFDNSTGTDTSGKAWRFEQIDGEWGWYEVTDSETIKALENAAYANNRLDDIVADNILSSLEKKEVLKEWNSVYASFYKNFLAVADFGLTVSDSIVKGYLDAYNALATYMNGGTSLSGSVPLWLSDLSTNQEIDGDEYRSKWTDYYKAESELLSHMSVLAKQKADSAQEAAGNAQTSADSAQEAAEKADEKAEDAKKEAGEKRRVFVAQPTAESVYDVGDLWVNATYSDEDYKYDNDALTCITAKAAGEAFSITHWRATSNATTATIENLDDRIELNVLNHNNLATSVAQIEVDIDSINSAVVNVSGSASTANQVAEEAKTAAQNAMYSGMYGSETYSQDTNPWNSWASGTGYKHVGALWYNTSTGETKRYVGTDGSNSWETVDGDAYFLATYVYQNNQKWSAIAVKFDANGNPTTASGFVTSNNFASIFAEEIGVTKAEIATFITEDDAGKLISKAEIRADQIALEGYTTINGNFKVDTSGNVTMNNAVVTGEINATTGTIGGWTIGSNALSTTSSSTAKITVDISSSKYFHINSGSALLEARNDDSAVVSLYSQGSTANSVGLYAYNSSVSGAAVRAVGSSQFSAKFITGSSPYSELVTITGLALGVKSGTTFAGASNALVSGFNNTAWVDFLIATGDVTLPSASMCPGKILFVTAVSTDRTVTGDIYDADGDGTVKSSITISGMNFFISNGTYWYNGHCE